MADKKKSTFTWKGKTSEGKATNGEIQAINATVARTMLRRQGIQVSQLKGQSNFKLNFSVLNKKSIKAKDISAFARQLATMITAGVPVVQSLNIVIKGAANSSMQDLITKIRNDVESGNKLKDAFAKHPKYFGNLFCSLIGVGEESGSLGIMLDRLATYQEKIDSVKRKIKKALTYPTVIVIVAFLVSAVLLVKVVPQFQSLFSGFGAELPAFTRMVINMSNIMQKYWFIVIGSVIGFIILFVIARKRIHAFARIVDILILRIPMFGKLIRKSIIARFCRTLATTFAAGMPLIDALKSVAKAPNNIIYEEQITIVRESITTGRSLSACLEETKLFPNEVVQMVAVGEETGEIDAMLDKVASIYEDEVDVMVDGLSTLLEPMIMVIIGVLVGGLVVAMYLPIFKLGSVV
tara:strand:+ start:24205 stop:25428 length:1224 start_codon:yes stop_codon:yes gene_type:complete